MGFQLRPTIVHPYPGLAARPGVRYKIDTGKGRIPFASGPWWADDPVLSASVFAGWCRFPPLRVTWEGLGRRGLGCGDVGSLSAKPGVDTVGGASGRCFGAASCAVCGARSPLRWCHARFVSRYTRALHIVMHSVPCPVGDARLAPWAMRALPRGHARLAPGGMRASRQGAIVEARARPCAIGSGPYWACALHQTLGAPHSAVPSCAPPSSRYAARPPRVRAARSAARGGRLLARVARHARSTRWAVDQGELVAGASRRMPP